MRIDDLNEADPFGARCGAIGRGRCTVSGCDLLIREAVELAHGRRHLTILHGDPSDAATARHLSAFYEELRRLAACCGWVRVRGNAEYVTVTVGGPRPRPPDRCSKAASVFANPGDWTIVASALPPLS